ncbi:spermatogenesis-associated protein 4-like [Lytechinus variegatus]|uniref:spermatogenesis-associated protein 4-like n=1 Tax=Lytechinus variegatus TaxID=7654 RepID=UPI001BB0E657|nr:spermatogenesis-associated protein 4-like [Lytechinus variegatus]
MATKLPRDVLKWIQSLDLTSPVRNVKKDFSNGYLVAEIFSWYYPQDITMHSYDNCSGIQGKLGNWSLLRTFFKKKNIDIPNQLIDGTIHSRPDAAELLVQYLYTNLTNRKLKRLALDRDIDFTDHHYQQTLPIHARNTAAMAVRTNLKITEFETEPNIITCQQKAQDIITRHSQHRQEDRLEDPARFNIKPTIGQKCVRRPVPQTPHSTQAKNSPQREYLIKENTNSTPMQTTSSPSVHFKEIKVNQLDHVTQQVIRPTSMSPSNVLPPISGKS